MPKRWHRTVLVATALIALTVLEPRLSVVWGVTALNLLIKEHWPFSHFPMYSSFGNYTFYLFLTNEHDEPVPTLQFEIYSSTLKKIYRGYVQESHPGASFRRLTPAALRPAGRRTLAYLRTLTPAGQEGGGDRVLRLHQVNVWIEGDRMHEATHLVAEG